MKELLIKNYPQKIMAIVFAMIIWAVAPSPHKDNSTEMQLFVPVTYANLPKTLEIISKPIQSISISIEFTQHELRRIHPSLFQAVIDLKYAEPGEKSFEIKQKNIKRPDNIRVVKISPNKLKLKFEKTIEKILPIHPVFIGEPAKGFAIKKAILEPETIKVRGPTSKLSKLERLETKAINIGGISTDVEMLLTIVFPDKISPQHPKADFYIARIKVGSEPVNLRFTGIPIGLINQNYVTRINPKKFNALVRGPKSLLESMTSADIQAFIELGGYKPGTYKIKSPTIRVRPELKVLETWPPIDVWVLNQKIYE